MKDLFLARVIEQHRDLYKVAGEKGELQAGVSGNFIYRANDNSDFPAVGDWVMIDRTDDGGGNAVIHHILRRKSVFERKAAGKGNSIQVVASNIDIIFICMSLNADFNLRRDRTLSVRRVGQHGDAGHRAYKGGSVRRSGRMRLAELAKVSVRSRRGRLFQPGGTAGMKKCATYVKEGKTIAFIGSSGVGKSTLINRLMGREVMYTKEIRDDDDKGRHTTTHRQLDRSSGRGHRHRYARHA